jgi:hypothetical protein
VKLTCPQCAVEFPLEAGFAEADGKRLAALLAGVDAELGRALVRYLRFFKPGKTQLRLARALKIVGEVLELVESGKVMSQGLGRLITPAHWVRAIEQLEQVDAERKLVLPLTGHGYLRKIAFTIADSAEAKAEAGRTTSPARRADGPSPSRPPEPKLDNELAWIRQQYDYGAFDVDERDRRIAAARERYGNGP